MLYNVPGICELGGWLDFCPQKPTPQLAKGMTTVKLGRRRQAGAANPRVSRSNPGFS